MEMASSSTMMHAKKMKTIAALVAAIIMMAMICTASAKPDPENMNVQPDNQNMTPGEVVNYTVSITDIQNSGTSNKHTIKAWVSGIVYGGGTLNDLRFKFYHGANSSGWLNNNETWNWWDGGANSATLTLSVKHVGTSTDTKYQFKVEDGYTYGSTWDSASSTVYATAIPEFSTIAIPAAAILGLLFFFNRRRRQA